jgi:NADPH2:quinone reductase
MEVPDPKPGLGQIRIRVYAATVNPTDALFRSGQISATLARLGRSQLDPAHGPPPWTPGQEVAGIVEAVGEGVSTWQVGERVAAITRPAPENRGGQAELAVVWSDSATRVPAGTTLTEAATLPMNGLTAWQAIDRLGLASGAVIAVTGAAGAVGAYAMQIALADGVKVLAVAAAPDEPLVRGLGAETFVAAGPDAPTAIRRIVLEGVDGLVDAALIGNAMLPAIREGGGYAALRGTDGISSERGIVLEQVAVAESLRDGARLAQLMNLVELGKITLRVAETFPPERAADAHRRLEAGGVRGRLVIVFQDE